MSESPNKLKGIAKGIVGLNQIAKRRGSIDGTVLPCPTGRDIDTVLDDIEEGLKRVDVSQGSRVKLVKAEINLLGHLEIARDRVHAILKSGRRENVKEIFGGNLVRVSRLRAALNSVRLSDMNSRDQRFSHCKDVCCSLEELLRKEAGFAEHMEKATQSKQKELLRDRASVIMDPSQAEAVAARLEEAEVDNAAVEAALQRSVEDVEVDEDECETEDAPGSEVWEMMTAAKRKVELARRIQQEEQHLEMEDAVLDGDWMKEELKQSVEEESQVDAQAKAWFAELDKNGDGKVTKTEMKNAIKQSEPMKKALRIRNFKDVGQLFQMADTDGSGALDFQEFVTCLKTMQDREACALPVGAIDETIARRAFEAMDVDHDGTLDNNELRMAYAGILLSLGERVSRKRVARWAAKGMKEYDIDGSKTLDFGEFRTMFERSGTLRAAAKMPKVKVVNYALTQPVPKPDKPTIPEGSRVQVTSGQYKGTCGTAIKILVEKQDVRYRVLLDGAQKPTWVDDVALE